jgi:hypothetical protein
MQCQWRKKVLLANVKSKAQQLGANLLISLIGFPTNKPNQTNMKPKITLS